MADNNFTKLLRCYVGPFQQIEDLLQQLLIGLLDIDNSVGVQLDGIGKLVGQVRDGLEDAAYRRYLRARIVANKSDGLINDLILVCRLILDDDDAYVHVFKQGNATIYIRIEETTVTEEIRDILLSFLSVAAAGGVRVIFESSTSAPAGWFRWDTATSWDVGKFISSRSST